MRVGLVQQLSEVHSVKRLLIRQLWQLRLRLWLWLCRDLKFLWLRLRGCCRRRHKRFFGCCQGDFWCPWHSGHRAGALKRSFWGWHHSRTVHSTVSVFLHLWVHGGQKGTTGETHREGEGLMVRGERRFEMRTGMGPTVGVHGERMVQMGPGIPLGYSIFISHNYGCHILWRSIFQGLVPHSGSRPGLQVSRLQENMDCLLGSPRSKRLDEVTLSCFELR
jgi:hypothetical protein